MDLNFVSKKQNILIKVFANEDSKPKFKIQEDRLTCLSRNTKMKRALSQTGTRKDILNSQTRIQNSKFNETLNFKDFICSDIKKNYQEQRTSPKPSMTPPLTRNQILEQITLQQDKLKFRGYLERKDPLKALKIEESKEIQTVNQDRVIKSKNLRLQKSIVTQKKTNKHDKLKPSRKKIEELFQKTKKEIQFQNFLQNEQVYFDTLNSIQNNGINEFSSQASLRQKYFYGQIILPENQFCSPKDLITFNKSDIGPGKPFKYDSERDFKMSVVNLNHMQDKIQQYSNFSQKLMSTLNELKNKEFQEKIDNQSSQSKKLEKKFFDLIRINAVDDVHYMIKENPYLINLKDQKGFTPLMICAQRGYKELIQTLFQFNINLELVDNNGKNAQQIAMKFNNPELAQYINILIKNSLNKVKA